MIVIEYILIFALNISGKRRKMPDGLEQCRKVVVKPLYFAALINLLLQVMDQCAF
jgi:hypothetical protein